jgi:hypothetical protein
LKLIEYLNKQNPLLQLDKSFIKFPHTSKGYIGNDIPFFIIPVMHRRKSLKLAAAAADHQKNEPSSSANQAGVTSVSEKGEEEAHQETPVKLSDIKTPVVTPVPSTDDSDSTKHLSHHSLSSSHHHQTDTHFSSTSSHPTTPVSPSASSSTAAPAHSPKKTEVVIEPVQLDLSNDEKKKDSRREHSPLSISSLPSSSTTPAAASPSSSVIINAPPKMIGWLRKRGHVVPNWKTRYFVLDNGFLTYYVDKLDLPPYGKTMKGQLCLAGYREATVIDQNTGKINQEKIKG